MTARIAAVVIALGAALEGRPAPVPLSASAALDVNVERHHYAINARVRPLLLFWIGRSNVGDAVTTRRREPDRAVYSLLIGSDPGRAPRRINRWGYIDEEIRGTNARVNGLMTESDEESIEQAEANIRKRAGERTFKIIRASIAGDEARSVVTSIAAPAMYSFREVRAVLDLARRESLEGRARVVHLPPGTRPGFLVAVAELMHTHVERLRTSGRVESGDRIPFVYHGRIYQLRATRTQVLPSTRIGTITHRHVIASQFEIRSTLDGALTQFSMVYGAKGPLAETPLAASFQPRWWLEIELMLDDSSSGPALVAEVNP